MRLTKSLWQTFKEVPNDAEIPSHQLMIRAGLIQKSASGLYTFLPMGLRALRKVEAIVRDELDKAGCFELEMPIVTTADFWKESGRWDKFGSEMLKMKDRGGRELCMSPTNEEAVVNVLSRTVKSYKQLPIIVYQMSRKFRDEIRPRFGVMRSREFTMKDAYSFHTSKECMHEIYDRLFSVYEKILYRIGLRFIAVEADAGSMADGDAKTHEFQVLAKSGEDKVLKCSSCQYAANIEKAVTTRKVKCVKSFDEIVLVDTPNQKTITEVSSFLKVDPSLTLKSVVSLATFDDKDEYILSLVLGDDDLNEVKLKSYLGCSHLVPANDVVISQLGIISGFLGPYKLEPKMPMRVIFDSHVDLGSCYITGGNQHGKHYTNFRPSRDISGTPEVANLRQGKEGDSCPNCDGTVNEIRGIECGHIFELGNKYTKAMNFSVLDTTGKPIFPLMGCYGLGTTRTVAASIEQFHDENGIIWPRAIAPYQVHFVHIGKAEEVKKIADDLYQKLLDSNIEVVFDDRKVGPGFKFKDADLLGLPLRLTLGERDYLQDGRLEITERESGEKTKVVLNDVVSVIKTMLSDE